jgi:IS30 family transposase
MQAEERVALAGMLLQGMTPQAIAMALRRSPSTISRELAHSSSGGAYVSRGAHSSCEARRVKAVKRHQFLRDKATDRFADSRAVLGGLMKVRSFCAAWLQPSRAVGR